jgi:pimeloyl-ACP methyl ester carboxylesterase
MGRINALPPPPAVPPRSPPVAVAGEEETRIAGLAGGPSLEARVRVAAGAKRLVVLCHPHPLYGGSMHSPVPLAIAKMLPECGVPLSWARFNFRGVGTSEGRYDEGRGEVDDVCAVIEHMVRLGPGVPVTVCGHSFGSWVGLRAAAKVRLSGVDHAPDGTSAEGGVVKLGEVRVDRILLVSPTVRFFAFDGGDMAFAGKKTIFVGSEDDLMDVQEAKTLASRLGAELRVFDGFDHHFLRSRRALAEAALPVIAPECIRSSEGQ